MNNTNTTKISVTGNGTIKADGVPAFRGPFTVEITIFNDCSASEIRVVTEDGQEILRSFRSLEGAARDAAQTTIDQLKAGAVGISGTKWAFELAGVEGDIRYPIDPT